MFIYIERTKENKHRIKYKETGGIRDFTIEELRPYWNNPELKSEFTAFPDDVKEELKTASFTLNAARVNKNDEFYTRLKDIDKELACYNKELFRDKVIYCPTDVAIEDGNIRKSNFVTHFQLRANHYNFKKLIATCLAEKGDEYNNKYILERKETENGIEWVETFGKCEHDFDRGYSSGDYRSDECTKLLEESDIVITNPPFSLFRDFFAWVMDAGKDLLVIGNSNSVAYMDLFSYIKDEKVRLGARKWSGGMGMIVPKDYQDELVKRGNKGAYIVEDDEIYAIISCFWFTTLRPNSRESEPVKPTCTYYGNESDYPKYENYDAIEVSKVDRIPCDYEGKMGVPITYLDKAREDLFEIVGANLTLAEPIMIDGKRKTGAFYVGTKRLYNRIIIQKRRPKEAKYKVGTTLSFSIKGEPQSSILGRVESTNGEEYFVRATIDGQDELISSDFIYNEVVFEGI